MIIWAIFRLLGCLGCPGGPWGGFGGSGEPKIVRFHMGPILALRCHVLGQNNLSHYVFDILGQIWALGAQKTPFWAKIGYAEKCYFPKTATSNFVHIAPKYMFWTIFQYEILIFSGTHQKIFTTADFVNFDPRWPKPTCGLYDGPEGSKWS